MGDELAGITDALRDAVKEEITARGLYLGYARKIKDPALKSIFESLASDEQSHAHRITAIIELINAMGKRLESAEVEARVDHLTGLGNRRLFDNYYEGAIARAARSRTPLGLLIIDLDNFKMMNDIHGHENGDRLLILMAGALSGALRQGQDNLFRWGGDEFVVVSEHTDLAGLKTTAERLLVAARSIELPYGIHNFELGACMGGAVYPIETEDKQELFRLADNRVFEAKKAGGGSISIGGGK